MDSDLSATKSGITDGLRIISYVADQEGNRQPVAGDLWQPVNVVNHQAWREIEKKIEASRGKVASGRASCLHYYMTANQMDAGLLARYTGQPGWLVRLHLLPFFFNRLGTATLHRYAAIFKVSPADLVAGRLAPPVYSQQELDGQPDA